MRTLADKTVKNQVRPRFLGLCNRRQFELDRVYGRNAARALLACRLEGPDGLLRLVGRRVRQEFPLGNPEALRELLPELCMSCSSVMFFAISFFCALSSWPAHAPVRRFPECAQPEGNIPSHRMRDPLGEFPCSISGRKGASGGSWKQMNGSRGERVIKGERNAGKEYLLGRLVQAKINSGTGTFLSHTLIHSMQHLKHPSIQSLCSFDKPRAIEERIVDHTDSSGLDCPKRTPFRPLQQQFSRCQRSRAAPADNDHIGIECAHLIECHFLFLISPERTGNCLPPASAAISGTQLPDANGGSYQSSYSRGMSGEQSRFFLPSHH